MARTIGSGNGGPWLACRKLTRPRLLAPGSGFEL